MKASDSFLSYPALVGYLTDLARLSNMPLPEERSGEATSYEKISRYDETFGYLDWAANNDNGSDTLRTEDGGYLAADLKGSGALVRIWSADPRRGHVKIYLDGSDRPAVDMPFADLFGTGGPPFHLPSLCYEASRGKNCYIPIPYQKSCRVVLYDDWGLYYHFGYLSFPPQTRVNSFSLPLDPEDLAALEKADRFLTHSLGCSPYSFADEETFQKCVRIPAGGRVTLLFSEGPGAVTGIRMTLGGLTERGEDWQALSSLALSAYWDGEASPSVFSTLGGFFCSVTGLSPSLSLPVGVREDKTLYSYWFMPFENGAEILLENNGARDYEISYEISSIPLSREEAADRLRFHAKWNRAADPVKNDRWPDALFLSTLGKGRFVGTSLHVYKAIGRGDPAYGPDWWWGEGDEKFFVDGERFPSWFGTGSEDYFGYAWGCWKPFSRPYHSQPFTNGGMFGVGNRLNNRFHIVDSVPFSSSFRGFLEKYHRDGYANWAFTNFWYLDREGVDPYRPVSLWERSSYYRIPYPQSASFLEGEELPIIEASGMLRAEVQTMEAFSSDCWSGGAQLFLMSERAGDYVKFWISIPAAGKYAFLFRLTAAPDYGIVQHALDGEGLGGAIDLFAPVVSRAEEYRAGPVALSPGLHELTARIVGKNEASRGYFYGLDYLKIEKA